MTIESIVNNAHKYSDYSRGSIKYQPIQYNLKEDEITPDGIRTFGCLTSVIHTLMGAGMVTLASEGLHWLYQFPLTVLGGFISGALTGVITYYAANKLEKEIEKIE